MTAVEASDLPALHAFVRGLRKDLDAVVAGLSLPYSNGPIEGTNTKFKLLKRQMYGTGRLRAAATADPAQLTRRHHLFSVPEPMFLQSPVKGAASRDERFAHELAGLQQQLDRAGARFLVNQVRAGINAQAFGDGECGRLRR